MTDARPAGSTTGTGAPAQSDRNSLTIGPDGPILLHDTHFIEQMAHFNRERVPARNVHAKGTGAFGRFVTTEDVSAYTKARVSAGVRRHARALLDRGRSGGPDPGTIRAARPEVLYGAGRLRSRRQQHAGLLHPGSRISRFVGRRNGGGSGLRDNDIQWDWTLSPSQRTRSPG
jgi:catalase